MTRTHAFSLKKIVETKKISAVLLDEIKLLMFEYCLLIISVEIYSIYNGYGEDFSAGSFILNALFSHTRIIILAIIAIQILFHALRKFKKYIDPTYGTLSNEKLLFENNHQTKNKDKKDIRIIEK